MVPSFSSDLREGFVASHESLGFLQGLSSMLSNWGCSMFTVESASCNTVLVTFPSSSMLSLVLLDLFLLTSSDLNGAELVCSLSLLATVEGSSDWVGSDISLRLVQQAVVVVMLVELSCWCAALEVLGRRNNFWPERGSHNCLSASGFFGCSCNSCESLWVRREKGGRGGRRRRGERRRGGGGKEEGGRRKEEGRRGEGGGGKEEGKEVGGEG